MRLVLCASALVVVSIAVSGGCSTPKASTSDKLRASTTGSVSQAIEGGTPDSTHKYAMGVCIGTQGNCTAICSGALILPNVVATARHCVDQTPEQIDCKAAPTFGGRVSPTFAVTTNQAMFGGGGSTGWYSVKSIGVPSDDHICGNDIALLVLSKNVSAAEATPITPGVQYLMWDPAPGYVGVFTAIGYGQQGPNGESGERFKKELIGVACMWDSPSSNCTDVLDLPNNPDAKTIVNPKEFVGEGGTCHGDSGSSAYEQTTFDAGEPVSLGVLSRGPADECTLSIYTRFDAHRDFVLDVAKQASNDWALYPEPAWTTPKPKPSPTKDAGATKDSGSSNEEPTGKGLGLSCKDDSECNSKACVDPGDGANICSKACDPANEFACPSGYACTDGFCLPGEAAPIAPAAAPATTTTTESCSASTSSSTASSWTWLGISALFVMGARRRKSANT